MAHPIPNSPDDPSPRTLHFATATQLAALIRQRQVSAVEVLEAYIAQIERHNPQLNALCTLDLDRARTQAHQADTALSQGELWGPLHGIPITVKDMFETAGLRTTAGYIPLKNYIPTQDATAVARLRAAGAILMGKSNLAELAGDFQSTNSLFERVNNPWDLNCTTGGSSGGSAAAVAAGLSVLDLGNDIAGSIRQPASFCGLYGLKPTDRRISTAGTIPEVPGMPYCLRQMITVGCLTRSLADLRLVFTLIAGADSRRLDVPPVPLHPPEPKALQSLTIAWQEAWPEIPVAPEIRTAFQTAIQKLSQAGAQLQRWSPSNFDLAEIWTLYGRMAAYVNHYAQPKNSYTIRRNLTLLFRTATQGDKKLRELGNFSRFWPELLNPSLKGYFETLTAKEQFTAQLDTALEPWDVWLLPVTATPAFTHRPAWTAVDVAGKSYPHAVANGAYTIPFNLSGHPAVVIPIGQTSTGLPIGLQLIGKRWQELELIAVAEQIDAVVGGFTPPPGYSKSPGC
jgi:amidase